MVSLFRDVGASAGGHRMLGLGLSRRAVAIVAGGALLVLAGVGGGVGLWLHSRPVLHIATSAQECIAAPDHLASLFSDDQNTLIRISNLDYSDLRVLRVEPAGDLPGMFDSLLALSSDSRRLAYVTADDELMDNARIQYLDVSSPDPPHPIVDVHQGLAPVRPAWSLDASQLAYVVGRAPAGGQPAGFEVWSARADSSLPAQKVADLPVGVFARGHSASLCWTPGGQIGLLQGVESALGQPGPSPLTGPQAASAPRTESPTPAVSPPSQNGSLCGVPILSQNDPSWQSFIMQAGGDPIGGYGCALTSTTMLLDYYGATMSPADLNACLGPGADPIVWQSAPACTDGRVQGGERTDFSWEGLDAFLQAGKPAIVGMVRGLTGMHFVVVTQGGGGEADGYRITDPWDGSTTKTLGSYTNSGYNPRWIISYDGAGRNCGRFVPGGLPVKGFEDGGTYKNGVTVNVPQGGGGSATVQQVSGTQGGTTSPSPSPSPSPSISPSPAISPTPKPAGGGRSWTVVAGSRLHVSDEGVYVVYFRHPGSTYPPRVSILKFTIDHTPPVLSLQALNPHTLAFHPALSGPAPEGALRPLDPISTGIVLDKPGKLRLVAQDPLSGVDSVEYNLNGAGWTPYSDDNSFHRTVLATTVGTNTIAIRASDVATNVAVEEFSFEVVDTTPSPSPSPSPTPTSAATRPPTAPPGTPPPTAPPPTPAPPFSISASVDHTSVVSFNCPVTFTFTGTITYTGTAAATFHYVWLRSDGATQTTPFAITFQGPGTQPAQSTTWTLGAPIPQFQPFLGWEQIQLQAAPGVSVLSNRANFSLNCQQIT
jgi:hypothetical protein